MRRFLHGTCLAAGMAVFALQAGAEERHCRFYPKAGLIASAYDLVGAEACKAACVATQGCAAWSYTPHNFRPDTGPGWCRLMAAVDEEVDDDRDYCGRL